MPKILQVQSRLHTTWSKSDVFSNTPRNS